MSDASSSEAAETRRTQELFVFEAINETISELYIGVVGVPAPVQEVPRLQMTSFPGAIAHWQPEHRIAYRYVEKGLPPAEVAAFVDDYAFAVSKVGWKVITD